MKRFKMGVFNNLHTHKVYVTNRKIIYQGLTPDPNPFANLPKPPPNPFANLPKPPQFPPNLPK